MSKILENKVAVITGGGTGIGAAIADMFADEGAHVVVSGRSLETISEVAMRNNGTAIVCDVSKFDQVQALFNKAQLITGSVDILVNNAGVPGPVATIAEVNVDQWRNCAEINLFGAMYCMREAARIMCDQKSGSIINMSSLMGIEGYPMRSAYCATKFAMVGMTEAVAREVGPDNVRVNSLLPGAVSGKNMDRILERRAKVEGRPVEDIIKENYSDPAALKRWVAPEEVAKAALFYASDASSAVTGDKMKVDCGRF
ncbi:MAG: SDR family oxidoreductase [Kordiimonadaceae bacterium]|jgi:NAD(P)-dependent dehydrogenase (short-subunit alcohol dehydrogenase family)|nr:SDR family oxidoreductase [Kordiimonadaceae bacterium]MBT6036528.1 SDR family oxidoreductase [Kordiimonadaceae bacterium]MBT6328580.1 SDR family oxidoreductase [Kordiimonadaceae bacterium]